MQDQAKGCRNGQLPSKAPIQWTTEHSAVVSHLVDMQTRTCFLSRCCLLAPVKHLYKASIQSTNTHFSIVWEDAEYEVFVQQLKREIKANRCFASLVNVLNSHTPCTYYSKWISPLGPRDPAHNKTLLNDSFYCWLDKIDIKALITPYRLIILSLLSCEKDMTELLDFKEIISVFSTEPHYLLHQKERKKERKQVCRPLIGCKTPVPFTDVY